MRESVTFEYKRQMYDRRDSDARKEMLRDISSIANAEGGVLIVGMEEDGAGTAQALVPVPDAEAEAGRIVSSCLASIVDRIPGLKATRVPVAGGDVVVVTIPRSYRRPHMVTLDGVNELWIRHDRQKSKMTVAEIRALVTASEELEMKVLGLIAERRQLWTTRDQPLFALTATPLLLEEARVDTFDRRVAGLLREPPTLRPGGGVRLSYPDSVVVPTLRGVRADTAEVHLLEIYRTGYIEFLAFNREEFAGFVESRGVWTLRGWVVAEHVRDFCHFVRALREVSSISDPYVFTLSLCVVAGFALNERGGDHIRGSERLNIWDESNNLLLDPMVAAADEDPDVTARRVLDRLWNAFHYPRCPFFDAGG